MADEVNVPMSQDEVSALQDERKSALDGLDVVEIDSLLNDVRNQITDGGHIDQQIEQLLEIRTAKEHELREIEDKLAAVRNELSDKRLIVADANVRITAIRQELAQLEDETDDLYAKSGQKDEIALLKIRAGDLEAERIEKKGIRIIAGQEIVRLEEVENELTSREVMTGRELSEIHQDEQEYHRYIKKIVAGLGGIAAYACEIQELIKSNPVKRVFEERAQDSEEVSDMSLISGEDTEVRQVELTDVIGEWFGRDTVSIPVSLPDPMVDVPTEHRLEVAKAIDVIAQQEKPKRKPAPLRSGSVPREFQHI